MIYFNSDYTAGAHAKVLDALVRTNLEHSVGYGLDPYTAEAKNLSSIRYVSTTGFKNWGYFFDGKLLQGVVVKEDGTYYFEMGKPVEAGWVKDGDLTLN